MRKLSLCYSLAIAVELALSIAGCSSEPKVFLDPVAYCAAIKTIDRPDEHYRGAATPDWIESSLGKQLNVPLGRRTGLLLPIAWRCADGAIKACSMGLGMPCEKKPSTSRVASRAIIEFCRAFPNVDRPLPNVGSELSAYQWVCRHGQAHLLAVQPDLDPEGYFSRYWFQIPPEDALSARIKADLTFQR